MVDASSRAFTTFATPLQFIVSFPGTGKGQTYSDSCRN
jgi:hypothetical protein